MPNNNIFRRCENLTMRDENLLLLSTAFWPAYTYISGKFRVKTTRIHITCVLGNVHIILKIQTITQGRNIGRLLYRKSLFWISFSLDTSIKRIEPLLQDLVMFQHCFNLNPSLLLYSNVHVEKIKTGWWFSRNVFLPISLFVKAYSIYSPRPVMTRSAKFILKSTSVSILFWNCKSPECLSLNNTCLLYSAGISHCRLEKFLFTQSN